MGEILKTKSSKAYACASGGATSGSAETPLDLALDSATSLVFKAFGLMFAALIAAIFFAGSAYADSGLSGSIPDNDVDASGDDATMIYESDFTNKVYTITNGGTYKLGEDITDGQIKVAGNTTGAKITLDLNGCSLSSKTSKQSALYIYSDTADDVILNVVDSKNGGSIVQDENTETTAVRIDTKYYRNEVTLGNVKIVSKDSGCQCVAVLGCNLTIDGATLQTEDGTTAELIYAINTFNNVCGITLNSGTFLVASDANGLFKFDGTALGYPSFTLNGGTYSKIPISENLGDGKIVWKTDEGYTIGDAAKKPSECKHLVALSQKKELWFTSEDEAESFTKSSEAGGVSFHKVSFTIDADKSSVDVPVQYIADGLCAIKPEAPSSDDYKFNYWKNGDSEYDFEAKVTADLTLTADWSLYVAQVGADKFTSVEDAVNEAPADGTVELLQDIESRVNLTGYSRAVTIDLKGHTIKNTESGMQAIMVLSPKASVDLTITDSGSASGTKGAIIQEATGEGAIRVDTLDSTPRLILSGVEIRSVKTECLQMIKGSAELNDVKMSTNEQADSLIYSKSSLKVSVNGGTYTAADGMDLITKVEDEGKTVLNGGSFNIFPANGTLADGKALLKKVGSSEEKGYFEVVDTEDIDLSTIAAEVEYSGAKVYFEDEDEATSFADSHEGASLVKLITAEFSGLENLVYNGEAKAAEVELNGVASGDEVKPKLEYQQAGSKIEGAVNAGNYKVVVVGLEGKNAESYELKGETTAPFEIAKAEANIKVATPGAKTVGDAAFNLNATADTTATLEYGSSNTAVAEVDATGRVAINAVGTAILTVSAEATDNYKESEASVELKVKAADFSAAKVTLSKTAFTYNGKAQKPSVKSVVLNGKTLKAGTDYTASIASGKKVGTYNVTIAAKGSYTGKATASFTVNPKGVTKFKVTKAKKSFKAKWKKNKTERSGVQVKYSTKKSMKNAKTVKAKGASVKAKKVKKLKKKAKYYVQVRAYKAVNGKTYYSSWSAKKAVKTK